MSILYTYMYAPSWISYIYIYMEEGVLTLKGFIDDLKLHVTECKSQSSAKKRSSSQSNRSQMGWETIINRVTNGHYVLKTSWTPSHFIVTPDERELGESRIYISPAFLFAPIYKRLSPLFCTLRWFQPIQQLESYNRPISAFSKERKEKRNGREKKREISILLRI